MVVHWLERLWSRDDAPPAPVLLRVHEPTGETPLVLSVELTWHPSGRGVRRNVRTADGLCVLHWRGLEDRVSIVVRSEHGSTELTVERRGNEGRVIELRLVADVVAHEPSPRWQRGSSSI